METFNIFIACILGIGVIMMAIKRINKKEPKWQKVYFFLVGEWHRKHPRTQIEIQHDLMELYNLDSYQSNLCIEHWQESSDWFEAQTWLNDEETKLIKL